MTRSVVLLLLLATATQVVGDAPPDSRRLDDDALIVGYPTPSVSPDGRWVAYVSRGFVCVVPVDGTAPPRRLAEVPDCQSHLLASPENAHANGDLYALVDKNLSHRARGEAMRAVHNRITATVLDLRWTRDSGQFVWGVHHRDAVGGAGSTEFWAADPGGDPRRFCRIEPRNASWSGVGRGYLVSHDLRYLVQPRQGRVSRPLIWEVTANRPRATPFLYLAPSSTSDRWIGVEKDTRQLVVTDAEFEVRRRYDVYRDSRSYGFEMLWSPNERFIVWRNQVGFDHYSNWEGFAMDLETGEKLVISGQYMDENFGFIGRGGEFFRSGLEGERSRGISGTDVTGAGVRLYRGLQEEPRVLWRRGADPNQGRPYGLWMSRTHASRDGRLFAVCVPREDATKPGCRWRLIDRDGEQGPPLGANTGAFESPCGIAGFADNDRVVIGCTLRALFAIPIAPASFEQQSKAKPR